MKFYVKKNQELTEEAGKNEKELCSLRGLIMDMRMEKTWEDRGEWRVVGGVRRMSVGGGPLATSNSFEVLGERHNLESLKDFPLLLLGRSEVGKICFIEDHTKPGDPVMSMVDRVGAVTSKAEASDYLVMVGGTNFVTEENVERLGPKLDALAEGVQGRVVWVETPYRYDLPQHNSLLRKQNEFECWDTTEPRAVPSPHNSVLLRNCCASQGHAACSRPPPLPSRVPGAWASPSLGGGGVAAAHSQTSHPVLSVGPC
ncbi:hypothetical protein J6590_020152 [Homalodisca vitripennis]|nr:hypothetical protein J6590_020152 [Homalodisca vitripennis]